MELEGLRGLAAIVVVIWHNLIAFYGIAFFGLAGAGAAVAHSRFEDNFYGNPFAGIFSGTFAVAIFFVLSGFVLSVAYFRKKDPMIVKRMAIKRYPRLMLPALASTLLCFIIISSGLSLTQQGAAITTTWWLQANWNFNPNFWNAIWSGSAEIFTTGSSPFNNVLWTMKTEFIGSFIVFAFLLLFADSRLRWIAYLIVGGLTFNSWIIGFVIGMALADLYSSGVIKQASRRVATILSLGLLALFFGSYPYSGVEGTVYAPTRYLPSFINFQMLSTIIGATLIVYLTLISTQVAGVLSKKNISILGKYTFSLYLIHIPVLYTFTLAVFIALHSYMSYNLAVVIAIISSIPLLVIVTIIFEKYVDSPSIHFGSKIVDLYYSNKSIKDVSKAAVIRAKKLRVFNSKVEAK